MWYTATDAGGSTVATTHEASAAMTRALRERTLLDRQRQVGGAGV